MASIPKPVYTFAQYLELERRASYRSEYRSGEIVGMAGGSRVHSQLAGRLIHLLTIHRSQCAVFDSNLRLYIQHYDESTYPDAMVICEEPQYWRGQEDVVTNPTVLVEVLSPSTEKYDRTTKSGYYRSLSSLHDLILVSQDSLSVEWSSRHDERTWITKQYTSAIDLLPLGFRVNEIYHGIVT